MGEVAVTQKLLTDVLLTALQQLHGYVGGAVPFDTLSYSASGSSLVLRLARRWEVGGGVG